MKRTSNPSFLPEGIINKANITSGIYWSKLFLYISKGRNFTDSPDNLFSCFANFDHYKKKIILVT